MPIFTSMSVPLSKIAILALAVLILGTAATASARSKKNSTEPSVAPTAMCDGTPIIMQGFDCSKRPARGEGKESTRRAERRHVTARGSSGMYVAPLQPAPSLTLPQAPVGPYIPPPVSNPSERIIQYNQSFPLERGLGNNPTDRDAYVRYKLTR
jgi:hypothetical protein